MNILLKNMDIITVDDDGTRLVKNANVGISGGLIGFIDTTGEKSAGFKADRIIDGKNKLAMPGLVNAHTHCAMTILRNFANDLPLEDWLFKKVFPAEDKLTDDDIYWGTLLGISEMIKSGTTAFSDMYLHMDYVAQAVLESGARANLSRSPLTFKGCDEIEIINETEFCLDYHKQWNNRANGRIKVYIEVHSAYLFDEDSLKASAELAKRLNTGIQIHILETAKEREESIRRYGMNSAEICEKCGVFDVPVVAAHCVHLSDSDIDLLKHKNVNVAHNPTSNLKLGSGIARIPEMLDKGINICLGTDGAASNNNLDMIEETHIAALIHKGLNRNPQLINAEQAIKMATWNGAKAIGFGNETGSIKEGMKADIIILDTDKAHLCPVNDSIAAVVYAAQGSDVDTVIIDGNIVMENRELKTIDEELVKHKVSGIAKRVLTL